MPIDFNQFRTFPTAGAGPHPTGPASSPNGKRFMSGQNKKGSRTGAKAGIGRPARKPTVYHGAPGGAGPRGPASHGFNSTRLPDRARNGGGGLTLHAGGGSDRAFVGKFFKRIRSN